MAVAAVFFDVDGTLVPGTSSSQYLAGFLGHLEVLSVAEAQWSAGVAGNREVEMLDAAGWAGASGQEVCEWLGDLPLVEGVADVVAWCQRHDVLPVLATLAWHPVGDFLCETYGFVGSCGPRLEVDGTTFTGRVALSFDEFDKRDFALGFAADTGIGPSRCAAIGDSRSDVPLFSEVGLSIAFNGDDRVSALAHQSLGGSDIRVVLPALELWLEGPVT